MFSTLMSSAIEILLVNFLIIYNKMKPAMMKRGDSILEKKWKSTKKLKDQQRLHNIRSVVDMLPPKVQPIIKNRKDESKLSNFSGEASQA